MKLNALLLICCITIPGCADSRKQEPEKKPPKPPVEGPQLIGRIASVPADKRFVLIQSYGDWIIESDRILTTRGSDERTANLRTTGETLGEFAAADLQSGIVEVGDAVYSQHIPKPNELATEDKSPQIQAEIPLQSLPEDVQKNN